MTEKPKPGTWHDGELETEAERIISEAEVRGFGGFDYKKFYAAAEPSFYKGLIKIYSFFQERFGIPKRVFYPSCDMDASPIKAFPNSEVTLLDINEDAVAALNRNGIPAIAGDVREYRPSERFDFLILLNPCIKTKHATHTLRRGGYVLANDYHGNTSQMLGNPLRYKFEGTIHNGKNPMEMLSTKESRDLLKKIDPFFDLYSLFRKRI